MADNRGRFLDVNGNKIVEVSTEVAMQAVTACLDDRMKGQMAALLPDPIVEGEGSPEALTSSVAAPSKTCSKGSRGKRSREPSFTTEVPRDSAPP